ncbi:hypothetical protein [Candidatus Amarobacter glycogenicus]|uniref:hypothetical protein n=1 Tax=Candidatus Amarobacter glycogenicus TaxID=3140699 RepID=UPI002A14789C|nr:hypothetical protein [Dehalococcoidia bacterium]
MGNKPEIVFMMKWRRAAAGDDSMQDLTPKAAQEGRARGSRRSPHAHARPCLRQASPNASSTRSPGSVTSTSTRRWSTRRKAPYQATQSGKEAPDFEEEAAEFNLASYNQFLSNAYIQGATKFFHDKYCKEGLNVVAANGDAIYTVYGDNNMLKAGGQKGVTYGATTSQWSREAIFEILAGKVEKAHSWSRSWEVPGAGGRSGRSGNLARRLERAAPSARHQRALRRSIA